MPAGALLGNAALLICKTGYSVYAIAGLALNGLPSFIDTPQNIIFYYLIKKKCSLQIFIKMKNAFYFVFV